MEVRCLNNSSHWLIQYCLKLLKLIIQSEYIIKDDPTPNSHFLKVALFKYIDEKGRPVQRQDVARYVAGVCRKLRDTDWRFRIEDFVADILIASPVISFNDELVSILDRARCSIFLFHDCTLL